MARKRRRSSQTIARLVAARRKLETPEQKAARLEKSRVRAATRRAFESEEERANRLARGRARMKAFRANLKHNAGIAKLHHNTHFSNSSKAQQSLYKPYLVWEAQRIASAKSAAERRSRETQEQRSARLEKGRIRVAVLRACESEEERNDRLTRQRQRARAARLKQKFKEVNFFNCDQEVQNFCSKLNNNGVPLQEHNQNRAINSLKIEEEQLKQLAQLHRESTTWFLTKGISQRKVAYTCFEYDSTNSWPEFEESNSFLTSGIDVECEVTIEEHSDFMDNSVFTTQAPSGEFEIETVLCSPLSINQEHSDSEDGQTDFQVEIVPVKTEHFSVSESDQISAE